MIGSGRHEEKIEIQAALNYGKTPVTNGLNVSFARVGYITQPPQFNTSGVTNGSLTSASGTWWNNTSRYGTAYGIIQLNSTSSAATSGVAFSVASYLGATVSYGYVDQRLALNGTSTTWQYGLSQAKVTTKLSTTGNVTNANATSAQNVVWVQTTYSSGNYTLTAYDWEEKAGGFQTVTSYTMTASTMAPLVFYEVAIYVQTTSTVVSLLNTATGALISKTAAMHPVLGGNLTKLAYIDDTVTGASSGHYSALILDKTYLLDHNTITAVIGFNPALSPAFVGATSDQGIAPTDPGAVKPFYNQGTSSVTKWGDVSASLSAFSAITGSATPNAATSGLVNTTLNLAANATGATVGPKIALTMVRSEPENTIVSTGTLLYASQWTASSVQSAIQSFLKNYVGTQVGVPAADVTITSYTISNIAVTQTFSAEALKAVHDYLAEQVPGYLKDSGLGLVNSATGAVDAGAAIGQFFDAATGQVLSPTINRAGWIFDPVNSKWYTSAVDAGFPAASTVVPGAAMVYVPGQLDFLGFSATGVPQFAGCTWGICLPGLNGAATAVSNFFASADKSVTNAIGTVANVTSTDVIEPITSTIGPDMQKFESDLAGGVQQILPVDGSLNGSIAGAVSGFFTKNLPAVSSALGSAVSSTAGALEAGVGTLTNTVYHVGASIAGGLAPILNATNGAAKTGLSVLENTVGAIVPDSQAVISGVYTTARTAVSGLTVPTTSLLNAAKGIGPAISGSLNSVGTTVTSTAAAITGSTASAFGASAGSIVAAALHPLLALGGAVMTWATGLLSSTSEWIVIIVLGALAVFVILLVIWILDRHHMKRHGRHLIGRHHGGEHHSG